MTALSARASRSIKIVVFPGDLSHTVCNTIVEIDCCFSAVEWLIAGHASFITGALPTGVDRGRVDPFDVCGIGVNWPCSALGFLSRTCRPV